MIYSLDYEQLGKRIKQVRKMKSLSQNALAEKAELTPNFIAKIEGNNTSISLKTLVNIANALEISIDYLFLNDTNMLEQGKKTSTDLFIDNMLQNFSESDKELLIDMINVFKVYKNK
ncbi:helix-turn-helix transcriptional regulator [Lachnospiraceae bacterium 46-61]